MKSKALKRELILEGLDCASCAAKIETGVKGIQGVESCSLNFVTKTLAVESEAAQSEAIIEETKQLVHRLEPHVQVKEKVGRRNKQVLLLQGLDCANCAAKIEAEARNLPGVTAGTLDFVSKRLILETEDERRISSVVQQATAIVNRLEPDVAVVREEEATAEQDDKGKAETRQKLLRLGVSGVFMAIAAFAPLPSTAQLILFLVAYLFAGGEIVVRALRNLTRGQVFDENFLMTVATIGAFAIGEYPEGVAVMLFYQVGELFQSIAVNRSRRSIAALMDIRPDYANVQTEAGVQQVPPEHVKPGDTIIVRPGEKVPLDGIVVTGSSMLDTSALTGESVPRRAEAGSEVLGGCINQHGVLTVRVTKEYSESAVAKILELVQNASSRKAPTESFITKFARYYTPFVVITAAALALLPPLFSGAPFSDWVYRALVFLVISCPCALVVSIPLGFFGGIGGASKRGILVKGGNYLEALNDVKYVVFDKTGTLTKGVFAVTDVKPAAGIAREELLAYAALAETHSTHPIAASIRSAYGSEIDEQRVSQYEEIPGHGVRVVIDGRTVAAGNVKLMAQQGISFAPSTAIGTVVYVAIDGAFAGSLVISDEVKEDAEEAIRSLKEQGIAKTVMLTGDAKGVGEAVGRRLGLDEVHAELLPHQKVEEIERLDAAKQKREKIVFVGDGINDTPVLARADIGIAMGGLGSDAAIEAADIIIMTDEPSKIATAIRLAKRTRRIVYQNIFFALGVKAVFLLLGAFGIATMWEAVFSDVGVTLLAVLNAMRVLRVEHV